MQPSNFSLGSLLGKKCCLKICVGLKWRTAPKNVFANIIHVANKSVMSENHLKTCWPNSIHEANKSVKSEDNLRDS